MKLNSTLLKATAVGALGGLLFGFDTAVIAGTTQQLTFVFGLTPATLGLTVSIALWGTVIGAMSAGVIGRRPGDSANPGDLLYPLNIWLRFGVQLAPASYLAFSHGAPFILFAVMMAIQFFVVLFFYPEAKGVTLEQLQHS